MAEQELIRQELGLTGPFIVENGGAILVPEGYFNKSVFCQDGKRLGKFVIVELGRPVSFIREKLNVLRKESNLKFQAVGDLSLDELSKVTRLQPNLAKLMAEREFAETILSIEKDDLPDFSKRAQLMGLKVIYGGQFIDVTAGNDKGRAVSFLMDCFKKEYGKDVIFFGIGDSPNDVPMLSEVDVPMLVQKPDKTWSSVDLKNTINLPGIGPYALKYVLEIIMKQF
jgi:mannosyl-3-phosphoglycerate phosphatase family protein